MFGRGKKQPNFTSNLPQIKKALFPSRIKTIVSRKFSRITNYFRAKDYVVMLRTDMYVTADLYEAKQLDKPRIV